jgi:hypothetical protein
MSSHRRVHSTHHAGALGRRGSVLHADQFEIQDQIGFGGNRRVGGVARWNLPRAEAKLPGNKDAPLAAGLHALSSHIPSWERTALPQHRSHRLGIAQLRLSVGAQHRLAVLVPLRRTGVVLGGIEFLAIRQP